jgi:hypothetical protein
MLVLACMVGALSACDALGGGGMSSARSRCGRSYVTDVYWGASAGAVGAWYGGTGPADGAYYYGDWYDPGDAAYDPGTNSGGLVDPNDGSGWNQPDDGSSNDPGGDPSADPGADPSADPGTADTGGDTSGGDSSGGDTSGESVTRLHLRSTSVSAAPSGCFACTMGCRTDLTASATGRQALGVSNVSYEDACSSAVGQLAQWSHDTQRERSDSIARPHRPI